MGYEIFFGILEFHSAPVPGIKTDRSLTNFWKFFLPILETPVYQLFQIADLAIVKYVDVYDQY